MAIAKSVKKFLNSLVYALIITNSAHASNFTIDSFTDLQSITDNGKSAGASSGTLFSLFGSDLDNVNRTFTVYATDGSAASRETLSANNELLISNSIRSVGSGEVKWAFDLVNITGYGNTIVLDIKNIDLSLDLEIVANGINGSSTSNIHSVSSSGLQLFKFSEFTDSSVFSNLTSLSLNFTSPVAGLDAEIGSITLESIIETTSTSPVPLPSPFILMGGMLLFATGVSHRKSKILGKLKIYA